MISQQSIYRTASEMIRMSGAHAAQEAVTYANELAKKGDQEGRSLWLSVLEAIEELQAPAARQPATGHIEAGPSH
jgi:hypothetical protein